MAKTSKLKAALDNFKGVDHKLDHQKKQQKQAEKRKRSKVENEAEDAILENSVAQAEKSAPPAKKSKKNKAQRQAKRAQLAAASVAESEAAEDLSEEASEEEVASEKEWETDEEEERTHASNLARLAEDSSDSEDEEELQANGDMEDDDEEDEDEDEDEEMGTDDEEDIALSDLESVASEDKGDIIPHQRLTINNTAALQRAYKSIALSSKLPFSENQVIVSQAPIEIADVDDDLNRELAFYKQSLDALTRARAILKKEGLAFSRPADYFAEMVKSDEHMGKIKQKLIDEAAGKRAAADARRQRDLKKFGKQVQVAKLQERSREKRDTMEKISLLKRKRQGADIGNANEADLFDVGLEDAGITAKKDRTERREKSGSGAGRPNHKRAKRDEKYGFGGKKRFGKSNDATSAADVSKFSVKKMKGGKKGAPRPGKSRRANRD